MSNLNSMPVPATASSLGVSPGFRLHRLEVRNWGTFDQHIHILDAGGRTALLIGENGSGKSTLVDALLTLLVPRAKRNYNLSAGGAKKKERDEKTYVLGAYGSQSESEESRTRFQNFSQRLLCYFRRVRGNCTDCLALVDDPVFGEESLVSNREPIGQVREVLGGHRGPDAGI